MCFFVGSKLFSNIVFYINSIIIFEANKPSLNISAPMDEKQYMAEFKQLTNDFEINKKALIKKCAFANSPYKVGDIIQDFSGAIKIEKIQAGLNIYSKPTCVYTGQMLKKDLTPTKKADQRTIWQRSIKTKF